MSWTNKTMTKLQERKEQLQRLVAQYNQAQQTFNQIGQEILKVQGAIAVLEEIEKEKPIRKAK